MIICLGPICVPIWQLLPLLLLVFSKAKQIYYWAIGKEMPVEEDKTKADGPSETKKIADSNGTLSRRPKGTGEKVTSIKSAEQWNEMLEYSERSGESVVVDFTASWCKPCKAMAPFFEELCDKFGDNATFACVDVDEVDEVSASCKVKAMPTFQVYRGQKKLDEVTGAFKDQLQKMVEKHCS